MKRLLALIVMAGCLCGMAEEKKTRELVIEKLKTSPKLDGALDDACWQKLPWNDGFSVIESGAKPSAETRFKIFHDGTTLYLGVECDEPSPDKIVARTKGIKEAGTRWMDDCVEVSLVPDGKGTVFYKTMTNSLGETTSVKLLDNNIGKESFSVVEWGSSVSAAAKVGQDKWTLELAIPMAAMDFTTNPSGVWKFNVGRNRYAGLNKGEYSVFNPTAANTLCSPSQFAAAKLKDFNPSVFNWEAANLSGKVEKDGAKLRYVLSPTIFNKTGEFRNFTVNAALSKDGEILSETKTDSDLRNNISKELQVVMPVAKGGAGCEFRLEIRGADGSLWKVFQQPADIVYQPLKIKIVEPAYRNNIYASAPLREIVAEICSELDGAGALTVELAGEGGFSRKVSGELKDKKFTARIKADDLKDGAYQLKASATGADGEKAAAVETIRKLPFQKGEVFLDKDGAVRVEGNLFLPSGWFDGPMRREDGINTAQTYARFKDIKQALEFLDKAQENGLKIIVSPWQELSGKWTLEYFDNKKHRQGFFSDKQREITKKFVDAVKNHPAIFGWYMTDEPEGYDENPEWHMQLYNLLKEIDPYHPCLMLNYGIEGMRKYYNPCDILFPDCYPNFAEGMEPVAHPLWSISRWTRTGVELGRATIIAPQAFCYESTRKVNGVFPNCRAPTFEELRNQAYQIFANDGKGMIWYSYSDWSQMYYPLRLGPAYLGVETGLIKDLLLAPNQKDAVAVKTTPESPNFQAGLKKVGNDLCIVAVNTCSAKTTASFQIKNAGITELHVLGEGRKVPLKDGCFSDEFGPVETHVYLSSSSTAEKVSLSKIKGEIALAEKSRFKKGNLAAMGAIPRKTMGDAYVPPPDAPAISASSDAKFYFTQKTGSLPFLLDGICEAVPNRVEMSWAPLGTDKNPHIDIRLVKPAVVSEVKLYTLTDKGMSRLTDGRVLAEIDGKWQEVGKFSGNNEHCVSIKFEPVKTQAVRIAIDKLNSKLPELRVLSEIEVYGEYTP